MDLNVITFSQSPFSVTKGANWCI